MLDITWFFVEHCAMPSAYIQAYTRILKISMPLIHQRSEYVRALNTTLILIQGSEYTQGFKCAWITPEYVWIRLNIVEYAWVCSHMRKLAKKCLNDFSLPSLNWNTLSTWARGYLFYRLSVINYFRKKKKHHFYKALHIWCLERFWVRLCTYRIPPNYPYEILSLRDL